MMSFRADSLQTRVKVATLGRSRRYRSVDTQGATTTSLGVLCSLPAVEKIGLEFRPKGVRSTWYAFYMF